MILKRRGEDEAIDQYGANIGIAGEAGIEYAINLSYVNNIAESGGLQEAIGAMDLAEIVAGYALSGSLASGSFAVIGEYVSAADSFAVADLVFDGKGATPTAWSVEAAYNFALSDKAATLAVGLQGTGEAVNKVGGCSPTYFKFIARIVDSAPPIFTFLFRTVFYISSSHQ